ncbi:MAG: hypothetical protein ACLR7U_10650 [Ruthenibacterium lactatiformans]
MGKRYGFDHPVRTSAGLSMDAFAVSISNSMFFRPAANEAALTSLSFGVFQA